MDLWSSLGFVPSGLAVSLACYGRIIDKYREKTFCLTGYAALKTFTN